MRQRRAGRSVRLNLFSKMRLGRQLSAVLYAGALVALAIIVGFVIHHFLGVQDVLLVFLPAILAVAVKCGFWTASWVSVVSVLAASFFFADPRYSFAVSDPGNIWALGVFLIASALTSSVASKARQRAETISDHNRILEQLYVFSARLAGITQQPELINEIVRNAESLLGADILWLERDAHSAEEQLRIVGRAPASIELPDPVAAGECLETGRPVEQRVGLESESWMFWPVQVDDRAIAVLGIRPRGAQAPDSQGSSKLVDLLIEQVEMKLDRLRLAEDVQRTEILAETEKLQTALLTSISHDLRTPLASILGNVTSVRRYSHLYDDETRSEMLEQAEAETLRLSRFVDNLLQMTRIEAGALKPKFEQIDLSDVLGSSLKRMERALTGHTVRVAIDSTVPMLMLDFVLTEQVIANLLDNAAKYSDPGTMIEVVVDVCGEEVRLQVLDEGPGIARGDAERIFDRFFRVEATDRRPAGTGLGLAICRGFVEAMGGSISVLNRSTGPGAVFTVVFPVRSMETGL